MSFQNLSYLAFAPLVAFVYLTLLPRRWQNHFLLAASLVFYWCNRPTGDGFAGLWQVLPIALLVASCVFVWRVGLSLQAAPPEQRGRKLATAVVVLLAVLLITRKLNPLPLLAGFASFFISQILLRIPLLQVLGTQSWFAAFATHTVVYVIVVGGLSAGLFEETARLVGAKLLKQHRTYKDMISFGLGHGLCEMILLVGLGQVNNLLFCIILQDPQLAASLGFGNDLLQAVSQQLAAASPAMVCLGILERVSAVMYHVFATCLVFLAVKRRRPALYLVAILAHTVFNAGVSLVLMGLSCVVNSTVASVLTELVLLAAGLACTAFTLGQRSRFDAPETFAQTSVNES